MSEEGVSVPHGRSYLWLRFPEEVPRLMAEHIIWQARPAEAGTNVFTKSKNFSPLRQVKWWGASGFYRRLRFPGPLPADLSKTPAGEVPPALILPLEPPSLKENQLFRLPWNKRLNKKVKGKWSVTYWARFYMANSECWNSQWFSASAGGRTPMNDVEAADTVKANFPSTHTSP